MYRKYNPFYASAKKLFFANQLAMNMTLAETILWKKLKSRQLGVTFVAQKVIMGYIVDFYCHKYRLVIEVDGYEHDPEKDLHRTKAINSEGIIVIRFTNDEVFNNLDNVVDKIKYKIERQKVYLASKSLSVSRRFKSS